MKIGANGGSECIWKQASCPASLRSAWNCIVVRFQAGRFPFRISAGTRVPRWQFLFIFLPFESEYASKVLKWKRMDISCADHVKNEVVLCRAVPANLFEGSCPNCV